MVEDSAPVRKRLVALLRTVAGAVAGVAETDADAVLLDLQLADGSGLDVLTAIKPQHRKRRVIVLSNFSSLQHQRASLAHGADLFLDKSQEFGRVPEILRGWIALDGAGHDRNRNSNTPGEDHV